MLNKIAVGTANFVKPYGILGGGQTLSESELESIFKIANENSIHTFDTAFAYGYFLSVFKKNSGLENSELITKFSVLDNFDDILEKIKHYNYYALLVHDPQNIEKIEKAKLRKFLEQLKNENLVCKIGVSVYDVDDLERFKEITQPELIQVPLNPLNQKFLDDKFTDYVLSNAIEVHGRSLFLQGILLLDAVPEKLKGLESVWQIFKKARATYDSPLQALLTWAFSQNIISKWVLGVSSAKNLLEIIQCTKGIEVSTVNAFEELKKMSNPLNDPRNWTTL